MCVKSICIDVGHLKVFSWNRTGIASVPGGFLCNFNEGPSPTVYLYILGPPLVALNGFKA